MKRIEMLSVCLDMVAEEIEIDRAEILSGSKNEDVVDARHLLVRLLSDNGMYPGTIAMLVGCTTRNVNIILNGFTERCRHRKLLRNAYEKLKKDLGNNSFYD